MRGIRERARELDPCFHGDDRKKGRIATDFVLAMTMWELAMTKENIFQRALKENESSIM